MLAPASGAAPTTTAKTSRAATRRAPHDDGPTTTPDGAPSPGAKAVTANDAPPTPPRVSAPTEPHARITAGTPDGTGSAPNFFSGVFDAVTGIVRTAIEHADAPRRVQYQNPIVQRNSPDPSVVRAKDGSFYAYTTEADGPGGKHESFPILHSKDMVHWTHEGDAFAKRPDWIASNTWAPNVTKVGDSWNMQYSARGHDGKMRIGQAVADSPQGPFHDQGVLVDATDSGYVIDPYLLKAHDGKQYLYYGSGPEGITAREVRSRSNGTLVPVGDPKIVMDGTGDPTLTEGSWVTQKGNQYYLTYSAGSWKSDGAKADDYQVRAARSSSPMGPFEKLDHPILSDGNGAIGPGHHSIVTDDEGKDWIVYHAWSEDRAKGRQLRMDPIDFSSGWPIVNGGNGPSSGTEPGPALRPVPLAQLSGQASADD